MKEYRLLVGPGSPPVLNGIEERDEGRFVRAIVSFEGCEVSMEEAQIILRSIRQYFRR
jgi:hypothetical protein